jgi:hypothetical protein
MTPRNNASELFKNAAPQETPMPDNGLLQKQIDHARVTRVETVSIEDDQKFRNLVRHVLNPHEALGSFISRTGLSRVQAENMTPGEITTFVQQQAVNAANEPGAPSYRVRFQN